MKMFLLSKKFYAGGEVTIEFVQAPEGNKDIKHSNLILTLGPEANDDFELGKVYHIDFRKAV